LASGAAPLLAEKDAGQQPGIGCRNRARPFGGEHHLMTRVTQDPPRHGHLGDVEIPVRNRQQHTHRNIIPLVR
jgi:hypothetical protein